MGSFRAFRQTKAYDLLVALLLVAFYALMVWRFSGPLLAQIQAMLNGDSGALQVFRLISLIGNVAFSALLIVLLIERRAAVGRLSGIMPRVAGFLGTFLVFFTTTFLSFRPVVLSFWPQLVASTCIVTGLILMVVVAYRLGKSFSIMPEAREVVSSGPYAIVRHPLYMAEEIVVIGLVMQYDQPWALIFGIVQGAIQYLRTIYEERVLIETFPEYRDYQKRTPWRFIPGLI